MSARPALRSMAADLSAAAVEDRLETMFVRQAAERRDAAAVIAADRTLTYEEICQHAVDLAHLLAGRGVGPGSLVAVVLEKGWRQVVAVLAVLRTGAAFVPVDPSVPPARLAYLLDHAAARVAVTDAALDARLVWPEGVERILTEAQPSANGFTAGAGEPDDLAYVIYTSGSTGRPKGVMIAHDGAVNTIRDLNERFDVSPHDRVLAVSSLTFDLAIYDIFGLLAAGGGVVMPDPRAGSDPAHWVDLVRRHEVTIWNSVPALMKMVVEYVEGRGETLPPSLRLVMLSGDWIPVSLPDRIRALQPGARVISLGGATEASIWSILYPIEQVNPAWRSIPYGRAMRNQSFHVLDAAMHPCATGQEGHLYIGGAGLARGYWRDSEKTAASFVIDPRTGERLYRTGDLGRLLPDGNIEFLGRDDFQVKVQGYRIELGEIETVLINHASVRDAVVSARGEDRGDKRLVAYVVPRDRRAFDASTLRTYLTGQLPAYMVPASIVAIDKVPLSANGKVDRAALPDPPQTHEPERKRPAESLDAEVGALIAGLLGGQDLAADDNLLELGITSIDIVRIVNALEQRFGLRPNLAEFVREPTVAALVRFYRGAVPDAGGEMPAAAAAMTSPAAAEPSAGRPPVTAAQGSPRAVPVRHVERLVRVIDELVNEVGADRFASLYGVLPLAAQLLGLAPPPHARPGSPFRLDPSRERALARTGGEAAALTPAQWRTALSELYAMTAPILLGEQAGFLELQREVRDALPHSDAASDEAWRQKLDAVAPLVERLRSTGGGRCAHVAHYGQAGDLVREHPELTSLTPDRLERWVARSFPTVFELNLSGLNGDGRAVTIWIVLIASAPQQMLDNFRLRRAKLVQAITLAERLGAGLVGMGGLIGSFSGEGQTLSDSFPSLGFTTGHAFSIVNLTRIAGVAAERVALDWTNATVAIVGAGSSIGAGCAQVLARQRPKRMVLVDVPGQQMLAEVASAIRRTDPRIQVMCSYRTQDVRTADLVLTVTSWPGYQVTSEHLKPGAIVIDDAYPNNVAESVGRERRDVLALDGRLIRLPGTVDVDVARTLPELGDVPLQRMTQCREVVGCFAETVTLAATHDGVWKGLGRMDATRALEIAGRGTALGFDVAPLQFFGQLVPDERIHAVAAARAAASRA